jgi:hypothetical protein
MSFDDDGLPFLPSGVDVFTDVVLAIADAIDLFLFGARSQWGIYLDGVPVVLADNVMKMGFRQDWRISTTPQEQGAFASYNKVATPFEVKFTFSTGGSVARREAFLQSIADIAGDTNLYEVVTPEKVYFDCNITHQEYDRDSQKAGMVNVDVWLQEIRETGAATFSNTKSPAGASQENQGLVQPINRGPDLPDLSVKGGLF